MLILLYDLRVDILSHGHVVGLKLNLVPKVGGPLVSLGAGSPHESLVILSLLSFKRLIEVNDQGTISVKLFFAPVSQLFAAD